jgi:hypothetical protein
MKTQTQKCSSCEYNKVTIKKTAYAVRGEDARRICVCQHPHAEESSLFFKHGMEQDEGMAFICYTKAGDDEPLLRTAPRWCPLRMSGTPIQIGRREAYRVISDRKPHGIFYVKEDDEYVGIDNLTGESFVECFREKGECSRWLMKRRRNLNGTKSQNIR